LTLLVGPQEEHPACKKEWWGAGMVVCLERGADLHVVQLMPLPLTISCFSKIQIGSTFLVPAHLGSPGKRAVKRVCVYRFHANVESTLKSTSNITLIQRQHTKVISSSQPSQPYRKGYLNVDRTFA